MPTELTGKRRADLKIIRDDWEREDLVGVWPNEMTQDQREMLVRYLATQPLAQLRRGQSLTDQQIEMAYEQKNDRAMDRLQAHRQALDEAVLRSEFEDLQHVKGKRLPNYENRAHGVGPVLED